MPRRQNPSNGEGARVQLTRIALDKVKQGQTGFTGLRGDRHEHGVASTPRANGIAILDFEKAS
jgi:hypothetical protein